MSISGLRHEQFKVKVFDDFAGDVIADFWDTRLGSAPPPAVAVLTGGLNGLLRVSSGNNVAGTMAVNGVQLQSALNWQADKSGLSMEARVALQGAITDVAVFVGFTDQVAALEMPFTLSGTTLTSNATDATGFLFDTAATNDFWHAVGVANDVDATMQNLAVAPVLSTYQTLRVDVSRTGVAGFRRNGAVIGTAMTGATRATVPLSPIIAIFARIASTRHVDVDYVLCEQNR